ncbi:MAG: hypothetical protein EP298_13285 [Gammaproteobacteria bacterium]|nr:MAG: hypothetical protein EP298_13285 [Gammaproteobacteria bacterium]UTW41748.1 hypothetical protein KFE69_09550 [bacterium SCSIO 12844]
MAKLRIISLDMDGCLFHRHYHKAYQKDRDQALFETNKEFFESLLKETSEDEQLIFMIGSNRQSYTIDASNSGKGHNTEYSFKAIEKIATIFSKERAKNTTRLDTFLLEDIFSNRRAGSSFQIAQQIREGKLPEPNKDSLLLEQSKIPILYAQMHRHALKNPTEVIEFDFYDDREDIIKALNEFYINYPEMIPKNVTLNLHLYNGEERVDLEPIQGQGRIDSNYCQTVKNMMQITIEGTQQDRDCDYDTAKTLTELKMENSCAAYVTPKALDQCTKQNLTNNKKFFHDILSNVNNQTRFGGGKTIRFDGNNYCIPNGVFQACQPFCKKNTHTPTINLDLLVTDDVKSFFSNKIQSYAQSKKDSSGFFWKRSEPVKSFYTEAAKGLRELEHHVSNDL